VDDAYGRSGQEPSLPLVIASVALRFEKNLTEQAAEAAYRNEKPPDVCGAVPGFDDAQQVLEKLIAFENANGGGVARVRRAFALLYHPDRFERDDDKARATEIMKMANIVLVRLSVSRGKFGD